MESLSATHAAEPPNAEFQRRIELAAQRVMRRCDELALCSEQPGRLTRTFCSSAMAQAHGLLRKWMLAAGMTTRLDRAANLIGRYDARTTSQATNVLIVGSHLDTIVNAGRFDGPFGVLLGLGLVELLREDSARLKFAIDVVGFCEEEGIRYQLPFIGSRAMTGGLESALLDRCDSQGVSMRSAIERFRRTAPDCVDTEKYDVEQVIGYIEPHIEQGPILEQSQLPVGVVEAIAGQTRATIRFTGTAGHAGTVPMSLRQDALAAAAEMISHVEALAKQAPGAVATVGHCTVIPNVSNVIPSNVQLTLDARHNDDEVRIELVSKIIELGKELAQRRNVEFTLDARDDYPAVKMDVKLTSRLATATEEGGVSLCKLTSGAGHDAAIMAQKLPAAMLFLRCRGGISHHPDESVCVEDVAKALEILVRFVHNLDREFD